MATVKDPDTIAAERELLATVNQLRALVGDEPLIDLKSPHCSFCGRAKSEVGALAEADGPLGAVYICLDCATEAHRTLIRGE